MANSTVNILLIYFSSLYGSYNTLLPLDGSLKKHHLEQKKLLKFQISKQNAIDFDLKIEMI